MLDHVKIPVNDVEASRKFYEQALEPLGAKVVMEWPGLVLLGTDDGFVGLDQNVEVTTPMHVAFKADRDGVQRFYEAALAAGGEDNGGPGVRSEVHPHYYAAYVRDPNGHNIEAVCHQPAT